MSSIAIQAGADVARRNFLKGLAAGGLVVAFGIPLEPARAAPGADVPGGIARGAANSTSEVNAWVVVRPDDTIVIRIARSEMGQGTLTGLAQLVAEELDADWSKVVTEYPSPAQSLARKRVWGSFATVGSHGIRESQDYVRKGGAIARAMLMRAAAEAWKVPMTECSTSASTIIHQPSGRTITYGKVAAAAAKLTAPAEVALKAPKDWKLAGKRLARLDTIGKTNGTQIYGIDIKLPGMLCAAIKACPVFGGKLKRYDAAAIAQRPGVRKILAVGDDALAVVADTWWCARSALDAIVIEWDLGPNAQLSSKAVDAVLKAGLDAPDAVIGNAHGDATAALKKASRKVEAVYSFPWQNHSPMEITNATAVWTSERCEVWTPTQNGEGALSTVAEAAGLPPAQCDVYKMHLGGGFGRRGASHEWVTQVVKIAREMPGTPIKLIWTREEDMLHDRYHPITQCKLTAGLGADGTVTALHMRISGQSIFSSLGWPLKDGKDPSVFQGLDADGEAAMGYDIPHVLVDHALRDLPVPAGFWRGVNLNQNALYLECFMDELAHATKQDPLAFRRKMMAGHPKHLAVLNAVAARIGWDRPPAKGVFRGIAQTMGYGSYVAGAAEITVERDGKVRMLRIVAATDPGYAVNPQQIETQIEGSFVYGLSAALYGECTLKDGQMEQQNFNTYQLLKLDEMPKVECIIMPSGGFWGGVGEPTIAVGAPAVLNAIFAATGKRVRDLPVKNHELKKA